MELNWGSAKEWVKLTQRTAIGNFIKEFGITLSILTKSLPLNPHDYLEIKEEESSPELQKRYQSLLESLLYIAHYTRPEITPYTNLLGRRTSHATSSNLKTGLQVLQYLTPSLADGIIIKREGSREQTSENTLNIWGYADASYEGKKANSQSGSLVLLNGQVVIWSSGRRDTTI